MKFTKRAKNRTERIRQWDFDDEKVRGCGFPGSQREPRANLSQEGMKWCDEYMERLSSRYGMLESEIDAMIALWKAGNA